MPLCFSSVFFIIFSSNSTLSGMPIVPEPPFSWSSLPSYGNWTAGSLGQQQLSILLASPFIIPWAGSTDCLQHRPQAPARLQGLERGQPGVGKITLLQLRIFSCVSELPTPPPPHRAFFLMEVYGSGDSTRIRNPLGQGTLKLAGLLLLEEGG